ncbi:MAG: thiamine pyrophosphate-binding protein [Anaerovoracaceae bacterium]
MKASDYIVEFLEEKGIRHFFGYQGTMIAHFVDSVCNNKKTMNHCCYNEQGAAFAAVGQAKSTGRTTVAYATSGPGAVNLLSGIADAYYDSAPVIFITGQLNTYEYTGIDGIRQNGFQEMDVVSASKGVSKYCVKVENKEDIRYILEKAYYMTTEGRPGPVVIDLPMNMQREDIDPQTLKGFTPKAVESKDAENKDAAKQIIEALNNAVSPVFVLGNGIIKNSPTHEKIISIARKMKIPVVTSMLGRHLLNNDDELNFGHLGGGYGHRFANIITYKKADLLVSLGCSLCKRQTAMNTEKFAANGKIIRVEIDQHELQRVIHKDDLVFNLDCNQVIDELASSLEDTSNKGYENWLEKCKVIREKLNDFDNSCQDRKPNTFIDAISDFAEEGMGIACDVGQHQVWTSQSFKVKDNQRLIFSGGHGAMGFALPASIGAFYGLEKRSMAICGDGAMQMNIQELQWIAREEIPVTIIVLNNDSLGLIQQQQEDIFESRFFGSTREGGYTSPDFKKVGQAYGIESYKVESIEELRSVLAKGNTEKPMLVEVLLDIKSRAYPKTYFGEEMYNQRPYISDKLMEELLAL